jgi:NAD-dependent deacetylase
MTHTADFYKFYRDKMLYTAAKPNKAHISLAKMEKAGKLKAIITQNIDNLHQKAGSKNVYELHGSVYRNYCMDCGKPYDIDTITNSTNIPKCECGGIIKPDVVLYEENLNNDIINGAINAISNCDTLIIAGTSLTVYPAAGFVGYFKGRHLVLINRDKTSYDKYAELVIREKVGEVLGEISAE